MNQSEHARSMVERFRELVTSADDSLPDGHYDELQLIIEAGIDAVLIEEMEKVATRLEQMALQIKQSAERG